MFYVFIVWVWVGVGSRYSEVEWDRCVLLYLCLGVGFGIFCGVGDFSGCYWGGL